MSILRVALLGSPIIERDGVPVRLDRQKALALLAYLALSGRRHSREALAALLWPELATERAYAALRQALWALNQALGVGVLVSERSGVALAPAAALELDVAAFRAQLAAARTDPEPLAALTAAAALYRGDLLEGLELRDSAPFAEWCFFERETLRGQLANLLDHLSAGLAASGEYEPAAAVARRRLALDPLHEPAQRALISIYAAAGQRSAALRQYEECARMLAAELGAEPEPATQALYAQIRATPTRAGAKHVEHREAAHPHQAASLDCAQAKQQGRPTASTRAPMAHATPADPPSAPPPRPGLLATPADPPSAPSPRPGPLAAPADPPLAPPPRPGPLAAPADPPLAPPGLPVAALARLPRAALALPAPTTPFVGREAELAQIAALLADPECRLLSLLGPGGIGKTRLAIEAARRAAPTFADGVVFVALAAVSDPELILSTLAEALGLDLFRRERIGALLSDYLRPRQLLLVTDNLEQLSAGTPRLAELLEAAPELKIIATSRERLGLAGEWMFEVGGLPLPDQHGDARAAAAVRLFIQGVRRANGGQEPGEAELPSIVRICQLVGGTPLAIELASAWARLMPLDEIAAAIRRDLDFLEGGVRGLPARHRGLRAVFEHSWHLLNPLDQGAFRRLAVFCGGFTREAVAAVLGWETWSPAQQAALGQARWPSDQQVALAALAALSDRSLVRAVDAGRYDLHELLRQYAVEHLHADPVEHAAARAAHRSYYLALLRRHEADLKGAGQHNAIAALSAELDNVRTAWRQAMRDADWVGIAGAFESLYLFYEIESLHEEGEDAFGRAASALANCPTPDEGEQILLINLLARWGWFALRVYRFAPARAIFQWSLELSERLGPRRETALSAFLATCQIATGGQIVASTQLHAQVAQLRAAGDRWSLAMALNGLAYTVPSMRESEALFSESLALCRAIGDQRGIAGNLDALAEIANDQARLSQALAYWEEALARYADMGYRWAHAFCLDKLGYVRRRMGELAEAERLHRASLEGSRAIGDRLGVAGSLDNLGLVALDAGDLAAAATFLHQGLELRQAVGHTGSIAISQLNLGMLALARGELAACQAALDAAMAAAEPEADWLHARILRVRARAALCAGDPAAAWTWLHQALSMLAARADGYDVAVVLSAMAEAQLRAGAPTLAAELATVALALGGEAPRVRQQSEAVLAASEPPAQVRPPAELIAAVVEGS